jgi:hypothetical protein
LALEKVLDDEPVVQKHEDKPATAAEDAERSSGQKQAHAVPADGGGRGFMMFLLFVLFAGLTFFAGLSIRHCKDTGGSLFKAMQLKTKTKARLEGRAIPAPAVPADPAVPASVVPADPAPAVPVDPAPAVPVDPAPAVPAEPAPAVPADPAPAVPATPAPAVPVDPAPAVPETPAPAPGQ